MQTLNSITDLRLDGRNRECLRRCRAQAKSRIQRTSTYVAWRRPRSELSYLMSVMTSNVPVQSERGVSLLQVAMDTSCLLATCSSYVSIKYNGREQGPAALAKCVLAGCYLT